MRERFMLWFGSLVVSARDLREERGQAVVEYAVLLALILVLAIVMIGNVGTAVSSTFDNIFNAL